MFPEIEKLIQRLDITAKDIAVINIFTLVHADAEETADVITNTFQENTNQVQAVSESSQKLEEAKVVAIADIRTNSVVVIASPASMQKITDIIKKLDSNDMKNKKVYIHNISNADAENIKNIFEEMFINNQTY